jgi:hypothetical protein
MDKVPFGDTVLGIFLGVAAFILALALPVVLIAIFAH